MAVYNIAMIGLGDADYYVMSQILKQHHKKISLDNFRTDKTNIIIAYEQNNNDIPHIILDGKDIKVGKILDKVEDILFQQSHYNQQTYGEYNLDWQKSCLQITKQKIDLTDRECEIISSLIIGGENGQTRTYLLNYIWGYRSDLDTHTLETHIYRLRQKIENEPDNPTRLVTIEGGYKLA